MVNIAYEIECSKGAEHLENIPLDIFSNKPVCSGADPASAWVPADQQGRAQVPWSF